MAFRARSVTSVFNQDPEDLKRSLRSSSIETIIGDQNELEKTEADLEIDDIISKMQFSQAFKEWRQLTGYQDIICFFEELIGRVSMTRLKSHAVICSRLFDINYLLKPIEFESNRSLEIEEIVDQLSEEQLTGLWYKYDCQTVAETQYLNRLKDQMRD